MKTIAYIGNFGFPNKNASGKRVFSNCKLLQMLGYRVICIGPGLQQIQEYEEIKLYSVNVGNAIERVIRNKVKEIEKVIKEEKVGTIIIYGALFTQRANLQLVRWGRKNNIKIYYDEVDWLDVNWHNPLRGLIRTSNHNMLNKKVIPECDGVICISSYLASIHSNNGKRTVIIPPLAIEKSIELPRDYKPDDITHFIYAGTTSDVNRPTSQWKDRIDIMFEKLRDCSQDPSIRSFRLDIYGMTEDEYIGMFPILEKSSGRQVIRELDNRITFHGKTSNNEVMNKIRYADFSILIRDKKRATMSGFPTKVSESITCGTPVLCNNTSDIKDYIENGENGFVMDDVLAMFKKALSLSVESIQAMKRSCSDNPFYYELYAEKLKRFLEG